MECTYNKDEFCTNDQCPMCADYCPVPDTDGVCKYEYRVDETYVLSPKGCLLGALLDANVKFDDKTFESIWNTFSELMHKYGYVQEEQL